MFFKLLSGYSFKSLSHISEAPIKIKPSIVVVVIAIASIIEFDSNWPFDFIKFIGPFLIREHFFLEAPQILLNMILNQNS